MSYLYVLFFLNKDNWLVYLIPSSLVVYFYIFAYIFSFLWFPRVSTKRLSFKFPSWLPLTLSEEKTRMLPVRFHGEPKTVIPPYYRYIGQLQSPSRWSDVLQPKISVFNYQISIRLLVYWTKPSEVLS